MAKLYKIVSTKFERAASLKPQAGFLTDDRVGQADRV
jgi:hypothetical protein